jgi:hypothetical protein
VWTHNLKDINFISNYSDGFFTGKAVKVGAGVLGYEMLSAAKAEGVVVISGECPTVGLAGGYTQGGGHSALRFVFISTIDNARKANRLFTVLPSVLQLIKPSASMLSPQTGV